MQLSKEDTRITAYALGEIEDATERAQIEAAVAGSAQLQATVQAIRAMGDLLGAGLSAESAPAMSEFDKARLGQAPRPAAAPARGRLSRLLSWPALSAATGAAAVALLVFVILPPHATVQDPGALTGETRSAYQTVPLLPGEETDDSLSSGQADLPDMGPSLAGLDMAGGPAPATGPGKDESKLASQVVVLESFSAPMLVRQKAALADQGYLPAPTLGQILQPAEAWNTEGYDSVEETGFRSPLAAPLSTFSIDVDTASYANIRRFLNQGQLPPADAVRIEELINYFPYADAAPTTALEQGGDPFAVHLAQTPAPWNPQHRLLRIALKGYEMPWDERPASNLVFLLDVSGSMSDPNKLPLVKEAMDLLIRRLDARDRVAVVVYAGASGLVLPSTTANNRETIAHALQNLSAGGSTNAGAGIELAYKVARDHFIKDGNNRVILCTDGDFNVGQTNRGDLADIAGKQAEQGISLTVLGFGMGNYKDGMLEELSNKGKGSYAYIDSSAEARKVFLQDLTGNLFKIARDVKIQVEFNPAQVAAYRLIGYENRRLNAEDFNDDRKKAGDIGPGHTVVALYEIIPAGVPAGLSAVDDLRYQESARPVPASPELATVKLRYKQPDGDLSQLITRAVRADALVPFQNASADLRFAAAVAAFGMRLSQSGHLGAFSFAEIETIAASALGGDPGGHRAEFTTLVRRAEQLSAQQAAP